MGIKSRFTGRRRAYDEDYGWHYGKIPEKLKVEGKEIEHPGRKCAIFLVHGIGTQTRTETAAQLRSGFEDAFAKISNWQKKNNIKGVPNTRNLPPPYIKEAYWANYANVEETFPDDVKKFSDNEKKFFIKLWTKRLSSAFRTYFWFLGQQLRLLNPSVICKVGFFAWLTYFPFQLISFVILTISLIRHPKIISDYLTDVRLYLKPRGIVERTIVKNIDYNVGKTFLQLIGLDWDFRTLHGKHRKYVLDQPIEFKRIIWVAHSLGTVISYNVLSDLFHRAQKIEIGNFSKEQKDNIRVFKRSLKRFVTLGSPIDKVAFLFYKSSLRRWPRMLREEMLFRNEIIDAYFDIETMKKKAIKEAAEKKIEKEQSFKKDEDICLNDYDKNLGEEWWYNFYHVFDPVSGALNSDLLFKRRKPKSKKDSNAKDEDDPFIYQPPVNLHIKILKCPLWAHVLYWTDSRSLGYILASAYGSFVNTKPCKPYSSLTLTILAIISKLAVFGIAGGIIYSILCWDRIRPVLQKIFPVLEFIFGW